MNGFIALYLTIIQQKYLSLIIKTASECHKDEYLSIHARAHTHAHTHTHTHTHRERERERGVKVMKC